MNKLVQIISILIFAVFVNTSFSEDTNKIAFNTKLPRVELEANTGLVWIIQFKGNININDKIYCKFRTSETLLASEYGFAAGYQRSYSDKGRVQIGIGYSNGKAEPFVPGGPNADDTTEYWDGLIIECNQIHYFNKDFLRIGFNIGFNFITAANESMPSINLGIIIGIL